MLQCDVEACEGHSDNGPRLCGRAGCSWQLAGGVTEAPTQQRCRVGGPTADGTIPTDAPDRPTDEGSDTPVLKFFVCVLTLFHVYIRGKFFAPKFAPKSRPPQTNSRTNRLHRLPASTCTAIAISLASPQGLPTASNSSARALSATGPAPASAEG